MVKLHTTDGGRCNDDRQDEKFEKLKNELRRTKHGTSFTLAIIFIWRSGLK